MDEAQQKVAGRSEITAFGMLHVDDLVRSTEEMQCRNRLDDIIRVGDDRGIYESAMEWEKQTFSNFNMTF